MSLSQSFSQKIGNVRPLNPCPSLDIDFANGGYVNTGGFANQESVGSANFKIGAFNGPDPIFTRATAATFRGSNGLIQYAPENLLTYSEQFDNGVWEKNYSSIASNQATSPDGTTTADRFISNAQSGAHWIFRHPVSGSVSIVSGSTYSFSVFLKKGIGSTAPNIVQLAFSLATFPAGYANFNILNGTIGSNSNVTASISLVGNGWYLCSIVATANASSSASGVCAVIFTNNNDSLGRLPVYVDATTSDVFIWGAQFERSSTARPYISTTTTPRYGPRFEYDINGNPLGLLMEEQSQNLLQYSEQFDNQPTWGRGVGISVSPNTTSSPFGTITADTITATSGNELTQLATTVNGASYTVSLSILKTTNATTYPMIAFNGSIVAGQVILNTNTGVASVRSGVPGATDLIVQNYGDYWRLSFKLVADTTNSSFKIYPAASTNGTSYAAGLAGSVIVWGAQLEQKPFATSYMPTVGGPMTRNADVVNSTIGSWYNTDEGTIVVKGDRTGFNIQDSLFEFTSGTTASLAHRGDGTDENFLVEDATTTVTIVETIPLNSPLYFAASYSDPATQVNATVNAEPVQGTTLASTITTPTTLNIAYSPEISTYFNGHIKAFRYYAKALPSKLEFFTLTT